MTSVGCAGVKFLNRFLSSRLLVTPKEVYHPLYDFLKSLSYPGEGDLMLNSQMEDYRDLPPALSHAERFLEECKETVCLSPFPPIDGLATGPLSVHSAPAVYASGQAPTSFYPPLRRPSCNTVNPYLCSKSCHLQCGSMHLLSNVSEVASNQGRGTLPTSRAFCGSTHAVGALERHGQMEQAVRGALSPTLQFTWTVLN